MSIKTFRLQNSSFPEYVNSFHIYSTIGFPKTAIHILPISMLETSIQHLRISDNTIILKQQFTMNELIEGSGWLKHKCHLRRICQKQRQSGDLLLGISIFTWCCSPQYWNIQVSINTSAILKYLQYFTIRVNMRINI